MNLTELSLMHNELTAVPESIGALRRLTTLWLSGNRLTALPDGIGNLTALRELFADDNELSTLPPSTKNLTGLRDLHLDGKRFTTLPAAVTALRRLKHLHVDKNRITALPDSVAGLTGLRGLWIGNNRLVGLPAGIGTLPGLEVLHLPDNPLESLPESLAARTGCWIVVNHGVPLPPALAGMVTLEGGDDDDDDDDISTNDALREEDGFVSIWLNVAFDEDNDVIGRYDHDFGESGGIGPQPLWHMFRDMSYWETWVDAAMAAGAAVGVTEATSVWALYDHVFDAEPGPVAGHDGAYYLGVVPFVKD